MAQAFTVAANIEHLCSRKSGQATGARLDMGPKGDLLIMQKSIHYSLVRKVLGILGALAGVEVSSPLWHFNSLEALRCPPHVCFGRAFNILGRHAFNMHQINKPRNCFVSRKRSPLIVAHGNKGCCGAILI
jgi:hypothetical protein